MDKASVKVLKYIKKHDGPIRRDEISQKFGKIGEQSLSHLVSSHYISQGEKYSGIAKNPVTGRVETRSVPNGEYSIEPLGRDFLEHKFWNDFDRWVTRICAIWGAITGTLALFG